MQEIGKVDLITADEEVELAQRIKAGDQLALEKLTKAISSPCFCCKAISKSRINTSRSY